MSNAPNADTSLQGSEPDQPSQIAKRTAETIDDLLDQATQGGRLWAEGFTRGEWLNRLAIIIDTVLVSTSSITTAPAAVIVRRIAQIAWRLAKDEGEFNAFMSEVDTIITAELGTPAVGAEEAWDKAIEIAEGWARSPSCLEPHEDNPCCHVRTGAGIADALRKARHEQGNS